MSYRPSVIAWICCFVIAFVLGALSLVSPEPSEKTVAVTGIALGGPFALTDQDGKNVTHATWDNHYLLVYFGFTHCPNICPLGLAKMAEALDALPQAQAKRIQPIFITLDPERDTPSELKEYVHAFHPRLIGLTGTPGQIESVKKAYRVYGQKQGTGADYMINHSGFTYLMAPSHAGKPGETLAVFAHETSAREMAQEIKNTLDR